MKTFLTFFLLAVASNAAITISIKNGDGSTNAGNGCVLGDVLKSSWGNGISCVATISGTGAWAVSGSNEFNPSVFICQPVFTANVVNGSTNITGCTTNPNGTLTGGSVELRIALNLDNLDTPPGILGAHCPATSGVYSCAWTGVTIAGQSIAVTQRVLTPAGPSPASVTTWTKQTAAALVSSGCSYVNFSIYPYSCPPLVTGYPQGTYDLPLAGQPYTDPKYGTPGCILANTVVEAPIQRYFSAAGNWVTLKADSSSAPAGIYDTNTCTRVYDYPVGYYGCQYLPNLQTLTGLGLPELTMVCYGPVPGTLVRLRGVNPPTLTSDGIVWTAPHGEQGLNDGGSSTLLSDGRKVFYGCTLSANCGQPQPVANWPHSYVVDMYTFQTIVDMDLTDARIAAALGPNIFIDTRAILAKDKDASGQYIIQTAQSTVGTPNLAIHLWARENGTWGVAGLENDSAGGIHYAAINDCVNYQTYCTGAVHQVPLAIGGVSGFGKSSSNAVTIATDFGNETLLSPSAKTFPLEAGGGGSFVQIPSEHLTGSTSMYGRSLYVGSFEPPSGAAFNVQMPILSVTGSPGVITLNETTGPTTLGVSIGGQIYIGCENGASGSSQQIMGYYVVSNVQTSPYRLTLTGLNWTGTPLTTNQCAATLRQAPQNPQDKYSIAVARMVQSGNGGRALQVAPIGVQYSTHMNSNIGNCVEYFCSQTKPQMSQDGRFVTATTNNGQPNWARTILYKVPWQFLAGKPYEFAPGFPVYFTPTGSGSMTIAATVPTAEDITCTISTSSNLLASPATVTLAGPLNSRTNTFTGVADTLYYGKCSSPLGDFTALIQGVPI